MEIQKVVIEEEDIGTIDLKEHSAGIDTANLSIVMTMTSENLYSNPINSIVREIASNSWDANKENNSTKPIYVDLLDEGINEYFIKFRDNGIGISPERFEKIYMNFFSSTKRSDNSQIGGWGLGSKTPFAYADQFWIKTVHAGVEYEYLLYKTDTVPKGVLLNSNDTKKERRYIP